VDGAAVELLGDGDVRHGRGGGGPVPMFLAGREPHDVAGPDLLNRAALALYPAQPGCDDQRLTERMRVPGCPRARFKGDGSPADAGWIFTRERCVDTHGAGKIVRRAFGRGLRAASLDLHFVALLLN